MPAPPNIAMRTLERVMEGRQQLSFYDARSFMRSVLAHEVEDVQLAALLGAVAARGETAAEVAGFAAALREEAIPLPLTKAERAELVDTCGTGGDASGTFNISTGAALVAAAAGAKVAKHGNRAVTSQAGSADVLEALGVPIFLTPEQSAEAIRRHGFAFLLAPAHHPALAAGMPVRRALRVRTMLHILGPLLNPAGARRQVMGVYAVRLVSVVAEAMTLLETTHAMVVHGAGGLDELALSGPSQAAEVRGETFACMELNPEAAGVTRAPLAALAGGDAKTNAAILHRIFSGEAGPARDVVVLNAAAVLVTAGMAANLAQGVAVAQQTLDSGKVSTLVDALAKGK